MIKTSLFAFFCLVLTFGAVFAQKEQTYTGELTDGSDESEYEIALKTGDAVLIATTAFFDEGDLDTVLTLYDPNGEVAATNDDADLSTYDSRIAYIAPMDGVYTVVIARYDETTSGEYTLDIAIGDTSLFEYDVPMEGRRETLDTEHFRFHYTFEGNDAVTPGYLEALMRAFEEAWVTEVSMLGWPAPPSDGLMGGNDLYDIYVYDLIGTGEEAIGYTSREAAVGDNPNTPQVEEWAGTSFIAIDNDFDDMEFDEGQDNISLMRTTAIHELHHAIQFSYDAYETHDWFGEATSTWMETIAGGKDQDATGYVGSAYDYPELCFGTTANDQAVMYGEWTFMQYLTDEYGSDAVKSLWETLIDYDGFEGLSVWLAERDTDIPQTLARYRVKNLARDYKLAPLFNATVWLEEVITGIGDWTYTGEGIQELGANYFEFAAPAGIYDVALSSSDDDLELWAVGLADDGLQAFALGRGDGIDTRPFSKTYLMVFNRRYDENVADCAYSDYRIRVSAGKGKLAELDSVWNSTYFEALK